MVDVSFRVHDRGLNVARRVVVLTYNGKYRTSRCRVLQYIFTFPTTSKLLIISIWQEGLGRILQRPGGIFTLIIPHRR